MVFKIVPFTKCVKEHHFAYGQILAYLKNNQIGVTMQVQDYRASLPGKSTRAAFVGWLNDELDPLGQRISIAYLRDLEGGRKVPSLALAVAIEHVTGGVVSVREWPGLQSKLRL
jgi:hypothetical protein